MWTVPEIEVCGVRNVMAMMGRIFTGDPEGAAQRRFASLPAPDRQALSDPRAVDILLASMVKRFRAGSDGSAWEARLLTLPWGFGLQDITVPVALWPGDADVDSPLAAATYLSRTIPSASLTVFPDEGYVLILKRWRELIRQLTDASGR